MFAGRVKRPRASGCGSGNTAYRPTLPHVSAQVIPGCFGTRWAAAASPSRPAPWSSSSPVTGIRRPRLRRSRARDRGARAHARSGRAGRSRRRRDRALASRARLQLRWILWRGSRARRRCACSAARAKGCPASPSIATATSWSCSGCRQGALGWRDELYDAIEATAEAARDLRAAAVSPARRPAPPEPAVRARGDEAPLELVVEDGGCRFGVDVTAPLGVGLFPDMRLGWAAVAARAAERRVLEPVLVHRRVLGARRQGGRAPRWWPSISRPRRTRARAATTSSPGSTRAKLEAMTDDAIKTLERFASRGRQFDLVVCDPPTFSHGPGGAVLGRARSGAARRRPRAGARAGRPAGVRDQLDQGLVGRSRSRARRGRRRRRAPTCASSSAWACRPTSRSRPGFPEGNYLKVAIAVRA